MRLQSYSRAKGLFIGFLLSTISILSGNVNAQEGSVATGCTGFKTYTQGGWGAEPRGGNPGVYLHANFAAAFPSGLTIGCASGYTLKLTTAQAVTDFLPSGSTPSALDASYVNPGSSYSNVLAGQLVAATLSVGFDNYDAGFGTNTTHLGDLVIASGTFAGLTVNQMLSLANDVIGGCNTSYGFSDVNTALTNINENYDNGTSNNGFLNCPSQCNLGVGGNKTDVSCYGGNNGSINITVTGSSGAVTYLWSDGSTSEDRTGLSAGSYSVTVTNGTCTAQTSFTISQPSAAVNVGGTSMDVTVVGGNDGSIDITVTGGTPPYSYLWNDGVTTEDRKDLSPGTYSVIVTDANGCSSGAEFTIKEPECHLQIGGTKEDVSCNGTGNGSIDVTATGGNGTVTYLWNDGATTEDRTGLAPGTYSVTSTDATNCTAQASFSIIEPDALGVNGTPVDVTVVSGNDGSIDITVTGGTAPYSYLWNDGVTTEDRTGLSAGTYSVTITDAHGCQTSTQFTIHEPSCNISVTCKATNVTCFGGNNGAIDITVTGATGNVTYQWSNGATTEDLLGLTAGTYTVTVTDSKGCSITKSIKVTQPKKLRLTVVKTSISSNTTCDATATLTASGGKAPYTYTWKDGFVGSYRDHLCMGVYYVTVTDKNGCSICVKIIIPCLDNVAKAGTTSSDVSVITGHFDFSAAVSPNPTKGLVKLTVNADASSNAVIRVYDINGKAVFNTNISLVKGINYKEINLSSVPKGIYQLQVIAGDNEKVIKVVVE